MLPTKEETQKAFDCLSSWEFMIYPKLLELADALGYVRNIK